MKIILNEQPRMTLEEFADKHGLVMEVTERDKQEIGPLCRRFRYYACFRGAETKVCHILRSEYGNGSTPAKAIANYARKTSGRLLVINNFQTSRREIQCPEFV